MRLRAYDKCEKLFRTHPDLTGVYVTTEASIPALNAAARYGILERLDHYHHRLVPDPGAGDQIGRGHRHHLPAPRTQGLMRFACFNEFLWKELPAFQFDAGATSGHERES